MNCQSVKKILPAFYLEDLDADQRRAVEGHLESCADCQASLTNLYSLDNHFQRAVTRQMDRLIQPANAWQRIQMQITSPSPKPANLRLAWLVVLASIVLLFSFLAVPRVYARLEEAARRWLMIKVPSSDTTVTISDFQAFTPLVPSALPSGFDLTTTGIHIGDGFAELQLVYARGSDIFLLAQTNRKGLIDLTQGKPVDLGKVEGQLIDPAAVVEEPYRVVFPANATIRLLTWQQEGVSISLYSNMPAEDILQFARSMHPAQR